MASEIDICNRALARIGVSILINSMNEASNEARMASLFYDATRQALLRDFPWPFATRRVVLANLGAAPTGWGFRYRYPVDALRIQSLVLPGHRSPAAHERVPFSIASDAEGKILVTDAAVAEALYTADVRDASQFDALFADALTWAVAAEMAMPLMQNASIAKAMREQVVQAISTARSAAFEEGQEDQPPESEFITVRA